MNADKIKCQRACDTNGGNNSFGSLFLTVLGNDNSKYTKPVSDDAILISLLTLSVSLARTEVSKVSDDKIVYDDFVSTSSQTDELKLEQGFQEYKKPKCIADSGKSYENESNVSKKIVFFLQYYSIRPL